jgi:hypothetical protein
MTTFESKFSIEDKVYIDGRCGHGEVVATVCAVLFRTERPLVEVSWVSNGIHTHWIEPWRLTLVPHGDA